MTRTTLPGIICSSSHAEMSRQAAELFADIAIANTRERGYFTVALAGGATPRTMYSLLAHEPWRTRVPWSQGHFFFGDERWVSMDHPSSNYHSACETLFSVLTGSEAATGLVFCGRQLPTHVYPVPTEYADPGVAADAYEDLVVGTFGLISREAGRPEEPTSVPRFDLVILGLGADGHTASLFPGTRALREERRLVIATQAADGRVRITMTLPLLNAARHVMFVVSGKGKAEAVAEVMHGKGSAKRWPAKLILPDDGALHWLVDVDSYPAGAPG